MYLYNPKRNKLHIKDYCQHARGENTGYIEFDSEDKALAYDGRAVSLCKLCQKEREKRLEKA